MGERRPRAHVNKSNVEGDENTDRGGCGGVLAGVLAGTTVGAALFVAILFAGAFIWYRERHIVLGEAAAEDVPDGDKSNDGSIPPAASQAGASQMLGDCHFPGSFVAPYPIAMYTPQTQMMPLDQSPPGASPLLAQPYCPPPEV